MRQQIAIIAFLFAGPLAAQSFDVATIKPVEPQSQGGRYITMQGEHRFVAKQYTVKLLIGCRVRPHPQAISGGPEWMNSDPFDIAALTPGATRPSRDQQMAMLRTLLADRLKLKFHREEKEFSIYNLTVDKSGAKLRPATARPTILPNSSAPSIPTT